MRRVIDTHQHLWEPAVRHYGWLEEEGGPLHRAFLPEEIEPQLRAAGVDATVLVQSADTYEDTFSMLAVADHHRFVAGVVGWVPLDRHDEAEAALDRFTTHPRFKGVRHLIHIKDDPDWIIRPEVIAGLRLLAERDLTFDLVAVLPRHLEHAPTLAGALPELRIVIDHLAKPPIAEGRWQPWAAQLAAAAEYANVSAKLSGLNTAAVHDTWQAEDLQPYVDHAVDVFSPARLMFGSDWPVATLAGDYQKVWEETNRTLSALDEEARAAILGATAERIYRLDDRVRA